MNFGSCHSDGLVVFACNIDGSTSVDIQQSQMQQNCISQKMWSRKWTYSWWCHMHKSRKWRRCHMGLMKEMDTLKTKTIGTWGCFVVLVITVGCGRGTKGSSSHSLLLVLSLNIWGTALCARQETPCQLICWQWRMYPWKMTNAISISQLAFMDG